LDALFSGAGFAHVETTPATVVARFPKPDDFLAGEIAVDTASIPAMQHLDDAARRELVAAITSDMAGPLRQVTAGEEVVLPFHIHVTLARP
jgi:hypothetical protein